MSDLPQDLLFVAAGDHHLLHSSLADRRNFDVVIGFYGQDAAVARQLHGMCDEMFAARGSKFQLLQQWCPDPSRLDRYDTVMVADDDVSLHARQFDALFARRRDLGVWILSPAHARVGKVSHPALAARWKWDHHFTNFIEVCTPVFRSDCLRRFLAEFDGSLTGWGLDYWYMNMLGPDAVDRYAVDDRVVFINPHSRRGSMTREIDRIEHSAQRVAAWERVAAARKLDSYLAVVTRHVEAPTGQRVRQALGAVRTYARVLGTQRGARRALVRRWGRRVIGGPLRRPPDPQQSSTPAS